MRTKLKWYEWELKGWLGLLFTTWLAVQLFCFPYQVSLWFK